MYKEIENLNNKISILRNVCINGNITKEETEEYRKEILNAGIEVFKNEEIKFYVPLYDDGRYALYNDSEDDNPSLYMVAFDNIDYLKENNICNYKEMSLKELCIYVYDNINIYDLSKNVETIFGSDLSFSEVIEYVSKNHELLGIIYNPFTDYVYCFEGWQLKAILFKGIGAKTFKVLNSDTNEETYEL